MDYNYGGRKIVAVLKSDLDFGVALNVLGHLAVSIGYNSSDHVGRPVLLDASGISHLGISKYPLIITKAKGTKIRAAIESARTKENVTFADYPQQMLDTGHDDELAESLSLAEEKAISYLGAIFYGDTDDVNAITGKFSLYK